MEECCSSNEKSCCCSKSSHTQADGCHSGSCHGSFHPEEKHEDKLHYFLSIADEAWEEVLKEKIKEYILQTQNDRMTELAKIVAEGNNQRWRGKMERLHGHMTFRERLHQFFSQSKK